MLQDLHQFIHPFLHSLAASSAGCVSHEVYPAQPNDFPPPEHADHLQGIASVPEDLRGFIYRRGHAIYDFIAPTFTPGGQRPVFFCSSGCRGSFITAKIDKTGLLARHATSIPHSFPPCKGNCSALLTRNRTKISAPNGEKEGKRFIFWTKIVYDLRFREEARRWPAGKKAARRIAPTGGLQ